MSGFDLTDQEIEDAIVNLKTDLPNDEEETPGKELGKDDPCPGCGQFTLGIYSMADWHREVICQNCEFGR